MHYKIFLSMYISSMLLIGCTNTLSIHKDEVMSEKINPFTIKVDSKKIDALTKEQVKQKALDFFKSYYDVDLQDEKTISTVINLIDGKVVNNILKDMNLENSIKMELDFDYSRLSENYYTISFEIKNKQAHNSNLPSLCMVNLNAQTGDFMWSYYHSYDEGNKMLSRSEAKEIAKHFLKKNHLLKDGMKEKKIPHGEKYKHYYFFYENEKDPTQTLYLSVSKDTGIVNNFSKGIHALMFSDLINSDKYN